jgi:hypothetical protein
LFQAQKPRGGWLKATDSKYAPHLIATGKWHWKMALEDGKWMGDFNEALRDTP